MKKFSILMLAFFVFAAISCKKDDTASTSGTGSWTLGGTTHKVAFSNKGTTSGGTPTVLYIFADGIPQGANPQINTLNLSFKTLPTASGTFTLVGSVGGTLDATQCELFAGGPAAVYVYLGSAIKIDVKVSGGKATFTIPEITLKNTASGGADAKLTASVTEM